MRRTSFLLVLAALIVAGSAPAVGTVCAQGAQTFDVAGTDAKQVTAFLKTLQSAIAIDNRLKVASMVDYPLKAWAAGTPVTIRNDSELQARYSLVFDASLRQAIASAKVETLLASQQGVTLDNGRVTIRPVVERKNALKIVAINEPSK